MGTATVSDQCTTVGAILTSPIIAVPPGGLSTLRPEAGYYGADGSNDYDSFTIGEVWSDPTPQGINPQDIKPVDVRDLECPTWGLGLSTSANGDIVTTIGSPWLPLIFPPMEIFSLDPKWASECTGFWSDFWDMTTLFLFDPPIALTPAPLLAPTPPTRPVTADPTTVSERPSSSVETAKPASLPSDPAFPAKTGDPEKNSPAGASADPTSAPGNPVASSNDNGDPISDLNVPSHSAAPGDLPSNPKVPSDPARAGGSPSDPKAASKSADPGNPSSNPSKTLSGTSDLLSGDPPSPPTESEVSIVVGSPEQGGSTPDTQGLGAIIYNAFGKSGPGISKPSAVLPLSPSTNEAISPASSAGVVSGISISLDEWGVLAVGSSTISLPTQSNVPLTQAYTVAGQVFTPNPIAFSIDGTTLSAGGPAVTISNTVINPSPNEALGKGSSITFLPDTSFKRGYTIAGETFTPNPSSFIIGSATISAGGPVATIDGTPIRLLPSGTLILGSGTITLLPSQVPSSSISIDGLDIEAQQPSFIVVDGVKVIAAATGVTISGTTVSLEVGGAMLDVGTDRFAIATTAADGTGRGTGAEDGVQAFTGGQGRGRNVAFGLVLWVMVHWIWRGYGGYGL